MIEAPLPGLGHNKGPTMEPGERWRLHRWHKAKAAAAPKLSVQIVRMRMRRAAELGMDYPTYAAVRASSGRDPGTLVFTSNALGMHGGVLAPSHASRIGGIRHCHRIALLHPPLDLVALAADLPFDAVYRAPPPHAAWPVLRQALARVQDRRPADSIVLIGATGAEAEWAAAGRFGGYLDRAAYFPV